MSTTLRSANYSIEVGSLAESSFGQLLRERYATSRKIILVDDNTHDCCLEYLIAQFDELKDAEVMLLPSGEENKVMEVCFQVWEAWSEYAIERSDVVINLGGGVVTDMGGFIASVYKRGLDFIQIPTSLLAMVDASIGGKTGIDLGQYKNQLGVFSDPAAVYIDPAFLGTLPVEELRNGYAEMLKHALIADEKHWNTIKYILPEEDIFGERVILESVEIKNRIVLSDPLEKNERKKLNFGHTIGHALEGFFLEESPIAHGHAVAVGMLCESFLSQQKGLLPEADFRLIEQLILKHYEIPEISAKHTGELFELMLNDKKNFNRQVQSTLLTGIGSSVINQVLTREDLEQALKYLESVRTR